MMPGMGGDAVAERIRANAGLRQPRLILASSIGAPAPSDHAHRVGFDAYLTKPVRHQALVDCLAGLVAEARPAAEATTLPTAPQPTPDARLGGRILLAEDNEINALLATTILEEAGFSVEAVVNGAEAIDAARRGGFDLILMDVQMPVLDGLQATREIRTLGGPAGAVPIVALTANAMRSDQDICLDAGMNDFVSKPLDPDGFLNTVYRFVGEVAGAGFDGPAPVGEATDLDDAQLDGLMRLMPPARFRAIIEGFLGAAQSRLQRIEACARSGDMVALAREAHDLKGVSGNFGARRVQQLADRLEQAARAGGREEVKGLTREIRRASITAWDLVGRRLAMMGREQDREVA